MIERLWQDVRYAGRTFVRSPGFALIAIFTIAIGVGANAAIFSVVNATLLRPLPYPNANELVLVTQSNKLTRQSDGDATPANFLDWRVRSHSFTGLAAFRDTSVTLSSDGHPERRRAAMVNASFFDVLQAKPNLGRTFTDEDEKRGAGRVAVVSDTLWRERFGGRPDAIGQTARFDDEPYTVLGPFVHPTSFIQGQPRADHGPRTAGPRTDDEPSAKDEGLPPFDAYSSRRKAR